MIPVTQTKVVVKNSKDEMIIRGNCYAACIASILEKTIDEIPNVETLFHIEGSYWAIVMHTYLSSIGWEICADDMFKRFHPNDPTVTPSGFSFRGLTDVPKGDKREFIPSYYEYKDRYYLVSGKSSRGISHMCIYQNGKLIHDPHPTREGLLTLEYFEELYKIESNAKESDARKA